MYDENGDETNDAESAARYAILLDKADLGTGATSYSFTLTPSATDTNGNDMPSPKLTYQSSDTSIATVAESSGVVKVSVKRGSTATGACTITGVSKDLAKAEGYLTILVCDYAPRLRSNKLTLNPKQIDGVSTALLASYGNTITNVELFAYNTRTKALSEPPLTAEYAEDLLTITAITPLTNRSITAMLRVSTNKGSFDLPLTVTIKNAEPAITVKQTAKFNLFYTDSEALLTVTAKGAAVTGIELDAATAQTFQLAEGMEDGTATVRYADEPRYTSRNAPYTALTLLVSVEGYSEPVKKKITLSTTTAAPSLVLTPASSIINTKLSDDPSVEMTVYDKTNKQTLTLGDGSVSGTATFATIEQTDNSIRLTLKGTAGGTAGFYVQNANWTKKIKLTHRVTVQQTAPTAKLGTSVLKLNGVYTKQTDQTSLTLNQANQTIERVAVSALGTAAVQDEATKINLIYSSDDGEITASFTDIDTPPRMGIYSFTLTPYVTNAQNRDVALRSVTLRVMVASTTPKVTPETPIVRLNRAFAGRETATNALKPSLSGYTVTALRVEKGIWNTLSDDAIAFDLESGKLTAQLAADVPNGIYNYTLTPTVTFTASEQEKELTRISFQVQVYNSASISATVSAGGKLDTMSPNSAITYTLTKLTNIAGTATNVTLEGADAAKFSATLDDAPNAKGQQTVTLRLNPEQSYATNASYRITLCFALGDDDMTVRTSPLIVKVTQSALKLEVTPATLEAFQSQSVTVQTSCALKPTSPTGAKIASVEINPATAGIVKNALGGQIETEIDDDSGNATIRLTLRNMACLRAGGVYTIILDVTPVGNASNVKPMQVKLTLKVGK